MELTFLIILITCVTSMLLPTCDLSWDFYSVAFKWHRDWSTKGPFGWQEKEKKKWRKVYFPALFYCLVCKKVVSRTFLQLSGRKEKFPAKCSCKSYDFERVVQLCIKIQFITHNKMIIVNIYSLILKLFMFKLQVLYIQIFV